jgi:NAD(P)H dehydrogenase (quinone)
MAEVLIIYDSRTGNTEKMAKAVEEGAKEVDIDVELKKVDDAKLSELEAADGIILGSPTYFGVLSGKMKGFIDESVKIWGKLENKIGAAFTSAAWGGGGGETAVLSLIQVMLTHGMIIVGEPMEAQNGMYGVISFGSPNERVLDNCRILGRRVAALARRLAHS